MKWTMSMVVLLALVLSGFVVADEIGTPRFAPLSGKLSTHEVQNTDLEDLLGIGTVELNLKDAANRKIQVGYDDWTDGQIVGGQNLGSLRINGKNEVRFIYQSQFPGDFRLLAKSSPYIVRSEISGLKQRGYQLSTFWMPDVLTSPEPGKPDKQYFLALCLKKTGVINPPSNQEVPSMFVSKFDRVIVFYIKNEQQQ
ncbi:MAG: hypothetical protein ABFD69_07985 [Candidatus Sumerlaeia bacterium]